MYNNHLAVSEKMSPEKMAEINNIVLELEKYSVNLGSAVTEEDDNHMDIHTESQN